MCFFMKSAVVRFLTSILVGGVFYNFTGILIRRVFYICITRWYWGSLFIWSVYCVHASYYWVVTIALLENEFLIPPRVYFVCMLAYLSGRLRAAIMLYYNNVVIVCLLSQNNVLVAATWWWRGGGYSKIQSRLPTPLGPSTVYNVWHQYFTSWCRSTAPPIISSLS